MQSEEQKTAKAKYQEDLRQQVWSNAFMCSVFTFPCQLNAAVNSQ